MLALPDLQQAFARSMLGSAPSAGLLAAIEPDGLSAAARLQVYANHLRVSLIEALGIGFPVVRRLVGEDCFAQLARRFVLARPPASPCMADYGGDFSSYLASLPMLRPWPYLAGTARLERALVEAAHAPEAASPGADIPDYPDQADHLVLALAPSVRLVAASWPVDRIWRVNQPEAAEAGALALEPRDTHLLVQRDADGDVGWLHLDRAQLVLLHTIEAGRTLARACRLGRMIDPDLDPLPLLQALSRAGLLLSTISPGPRERRPS
jgi:hypothetical protein